MSINQNILDDLERRMLKLESNEEVTKLIMRNQQIILESLVDLLAVKTYSEAKNDKQMIN